MRPWRIWYHLIASTYGSWLPGDPRGFRTRNHREHVEGNYKHPPADGQHVGRFDHAHRLTARDAVVLTVPEREIVVRCFVDMFTASGTRVLASSVSGTHAHLLAQFSETVNINDEQRVMQGGAQRHIMGIAKRQSSRLLKRTGSREAALWAKRCKVVPIADREHQVNVFRYICDHRDEGAAVWTFADDRVGK